MALRIEIEPDLGPQAARITLDGARYTLSLFYVRRAGGWHFHLDADDGVRLLSGVRIVANVPLLNPYRNIDGVPRGLLQLLGSIIPPREPTRDEVGTLFELFYLFNDPSLQPDLP